MNATEILELVRAGYTKEEITAMTQEPAPAAPPAEDPQPEDKTPDETPPAPANEETQIDKLMKAFGMKLDGLTKAIQSSNIHSVEGSTPQPNDVDTIIAKIINPHYGEKKEG